jgi:hypothetical protein
MVAAREERRRNRARIDYSEWDGAEEAMAGADEDGGGRIEDPYDGHLNAEELSRSLLDLVTLYGQAAGSGVRGAGDGGLGHPKRPPRSLSHRLPFANSQTGANPTAARHL